MFEGMYSSILEEGSVEELEVLLKNFLELRSLHTKAGKKVGDLTDELCFRYQYPKSEYLHQEISNPLEVAAYHGHIPLLQKFLDIGVEFRKKNTSPPQDNKLYLLSKAAQNNKINVIEWLLEKKVSTHPNIFSQSDFDFALIIAVQKNNFAAIELLVNANMPIDYDVLLSRLFEQPSIDVKIAKLLLEKRGALLLPPAASKNWASGFFRLVHDNDIKLLLKSCSDLPFEHLPDDKQKKIASLIVQNIIEDSNGDEKLIRKNLLFYLVRIGDFKVSSLHDLIFDSLSEKYPKYKNDMVQKKLINTASRIQDTMSFARFNFKEAWLFGVNSNATTLFLLCELALMKDNIVLSASQETFPSEVFRCILEMACAKDLAQKDEDTTSKNVEAFFIKVFNFRQKYKLTRKEEIEKIKLYLNAVSTECLEKETDRAEFVVKAIAVIIRIPSNKKRAELFNYCATLPVATKGFFPSLPGFFKQLANEDFNEAKYQEKSYYDYQASAVKNLNEIIKELEKFLQDSVVESTLSIKKRS